MDPWTNGVRSFMADQYGKYYKNADGSVSRPVREEPVLNVDVPYADPAPKTSAPKVSVKPQPKMPAFTGSRSPGPGTIEVASDYQEERIANATEKQLEFMKERASNKKKADMALAGAEFIINVLNAQSAYNTAKGQAGLNITMARNQAADALYRGHQAAMDAQSEGNNAGQSALLNMAAQGQDVNGSAVTKVQGSYEAMGVYNGMREEINSMREALGFELEEVAIDYQLKTAKAARNASMISSGLTLAAKSYAAGA
jgi:hypothetical protein